MRDFSSGLHNADDSGQRANTVGDIVRTVCKGHGTGSKYHHGCEDFLNTGKVKITVSIGVNLNLVDQVPAYGGQHDTEKCRHNKTHTGC